VYSSANMEPHHDTEDPHFAFKVSILGDRRTGKSAFIKCMRDYAPGKSQSQPMGISSYSINMCRQMYAMNGIVFDMFVEDSITPMDSFRDAGRAIADCAATVVVFDITKRSSFEHVVDWIRLANSYCKYSRRVLVGTRHHLKKRRSVSKAEARDLAAEHDCPYIELSVELPGDEGVAAQAQLHNGVKFALDTLALDVMQHLPDPPTFESLRGRNIQALPRYAELDLSGAPVLRASPKRGSLLPPSRDSARTRMKDLDKPEDGPRRYSPTKSDRVSTVDEWETHNL